MDQQRDYIMLEKKKWQKDLRRRTLNDNAIANVVDEEKTWSEGQRQQHRKIIFNFHPLIYFYFLYIYIYLFLFFIFVGVD